MTKVRVSATGLSKRYHRTINVRGDQARGARPAELIRRTLRKLSANDEGLRSTEAFWALKDVSFELNDGDRLGIIGRNGAGKSTLLKILSRITYPTEGEARIWGRTASLLEVGTGFNPALTGYKNIYLNAALHGLSKREIDRKLADIVEFSGVGQFLHTPVKHYSSGMYMRLAFAVAAHLDPDVLILDEVLAVGDLAFQEKCLNRIEGFTKEGRTILFVSHSLGHVAQFCTHVLWLDDGRVRFYGDTTTGLDLYRDSVKPHATAQLESRKDRTGSGTARITKVSLTDEAGAPLSSVRTGQSIRITLDYELQQPFSPPPNDVLINLVFVNEKGQRLFGTPSDALRADLTPLAPKGRLSCLVNHLPLLPGVYDFHIGFLINRQLMDKIENAGRLTVFEGDPFGTGRLPNKLFGDICTSYSWDHWHHA